MENFFDKLYCDLHRKVSNDNEFCNRICSKLTSLFPIIRDFECLPENKHIIELCEGEFDVINKIVMKIFNREAIRPHLKSDIV
jgi:hypothetical protein